MRRVFVTGAGHGIGRALVEAFTKAGDRVAFCDIDTMRGEEVASATGARFFAFDVSIQENWQLEGFRPQQFRGKTRGQKLLLRAVGG